MMPKILNYTPDDLEKALVLSNVMDHQKRILKIAYALAAARENGRVKALLGIPEPLEPQGE